MAGDVTLNIHVADPPIGLRQHKCPRRGDPVKEVAQFCDTHDIFFTEDNYRVLVKEGRKGEPKQRVVSSFADCKEFERLRLTDGNLLVRDILEEIEVGIRNLATTSSEEKVAEVLGWSHSLLINVCIENEELNQWFNGEVLEHEGFDCILTAFVAVHKHEDMNASISLAGSLLGSLVYWMQFNYAHEHLQECHELISVELCEALLATLFGCRLSVFHSVECNFSSDTRRAAFLFLYYLLQASRQAQQVFHLCCTQMKLPNLKSYYHLLSASATNDELPEHGYARMLLNLIVNAPDIRADVLARLDCVDPNGRLRHLRLQTSEAMAQVNQELLLHSCAGATISAELTKSDTKSSLLEELEQLKNQNSALAKRKLKVENDLRKMHQAMSKMVEFLDVKDDLINQSLSAIIRFGWDSVYWERGYTALHFAAELTDDPDVVELLAMLATDFNCRDDDGFRPLDYARKEDRRENTRVLEKLRERMVRDRRAQDALALSATPSFGLPVDLTPELHAGMEAVAQLGWKEIVWPRGYTALHLAAACGHLGAVKILLEDIEGVALDIARVDDRGRRPIDYATENHHTEVAEYLENFDPLAQQQQQHTERSKDKEETNQGGVGSPSMQSVRTFRQRKTVARRQHTTASLGSPNEVPPEVSAPMRKICADVLNGKKLSAPDFFPLHAAAKVGDISAIYFLLKKGITASTIDAEGKTAKDYAREAKFEDCVTALEEEESEARAAAVTSPVTATENAKLERELAQARQQLRALLAEKNTAKQEEETQLNRQLRAKVTNLTQQLETGKSGQSVGPLTPSQVEDCLEKLNTFGPQAFRDKLIESKLSGGLGLNPDEAACALEQMLCVQASRGKDPPRRALCPSCQGNVEPAAPSTTASTDAPSTQDDSAGPKGLPKGKGPPVPAGKGPPVPKGKGPPVPAGKGPPVPTGKGPPVPKGKGPPVPAGKGPAVPAGKGPPVPAGKGPPVPTGKGPPTPVGKGPPAPAGKGPSEPAGKDGVSKGGKGKPAVPGKGGELADKPPKPLKSLWWSKLKFEQMKTQNTVWHDITMFHSQISTLLKGELVDEFEARFAKESTRQVAKPKPKKREGEEKDKKKKKGSSEGLRVVTDPQLIVGREAAVKALPDPTTVGKAVMELDDVILSASLLEVVKHNCCPTPPQLMQLQELRKENPVTPWALPEKYMWQLGRIPAYQQRIDCWLFVRTYEELVTQYNAALDSILGVIDAMRNSSSLPLLLALMLACGNYLNAGTNRGDADGFDFDALTKLETVKDNDGKKNLVSFLIEVFFGKVDTKGYFAEAASAFGRDLARMLLNIRRRIQRDSDGSEKLEKSVVYNIEDFDALIKALSDECDHRYESLQMCLQFFDDPADPLRTVLAVDFLNAKEKLKKLVQKKEKCRSTFSELQSYFNCSPGMSSTDLFMLWDNLLIPGDLVVNKSETMKKKYIVPMFCLGKVIDKDSMEVLWDLRRAGGKKKRRSRRDSSQTLRSRHSRHDSVFE